jgi:hypothetical protein
LTNIVNYAKIKSDELMLKKTIIALSIIIALFLIWNLYLQNKNKNYNRILNEVTIGHDINNNGIWDELEPMLASNPIINKTQKLKYYFTEYVIAEKTKYDVWEKTHDTKLLQVAELNELKIYDCVMYAAELSLGESAMIQLEDLDKEKDDLIYNTAETITKSYIIEGKSDLYSSSLMSKEEQIKNCNYGDKK